MNIFFPGEFIITKTAQFPRVENRHLTLRVQGCDDPIGITAVVGTARPHVSVRTRTRGAQQTKSVATFNDNRVVSRRLSLRYHFLGC
jgi:hypothetical protein